MHVEIHETATVSIDAGPARDSSSLQLHVSPPSLGHNARNSSSPADFWEPSVSSSPSPLTKSGVQYRNML